MAQIKGTTITTFCAGAADATLATAIANFETAFAAIQAAAAYGVQPQIIDTGLTTIADSTGAIKEYQAWASVTYPTA